MAQQEKVDLKDIKIAEETSIGKLLSKDGDRSKWYLLVPVAALGLGMSLFHLYTAFQGILPAWQQRSITLAFILLLIPFIYPFKKGPKPLRVGMDVLYFVLSLAVISYTLWAYPEITFRDGSPNTADLIIGTLTVLLVLEGTRRAVGYFMTLIIGVFVIYVFFGDRLSGMLGHPGFGLEQVINNFYITTHGVFGLILGTMSNYIIVFIIFGAFLANSQAGRFFIELAYSMTGSRTGGPAKVAVIASGLIGMIQGAAVSNVATTGTLTIPLMKRVGYKPAFAGGVEAAASAGGQLMPPIMGASAFLIAANLNIPYIELALFALIPAIFHYVAVYLMVHFEAHKNNLGGIPRSELPDMKKVFLEGWFLLLPILIIITLLAMGYSPQLAGFYSIVAIIVVSMFRKGTRMSFKDILNALEAGARNSIAIGVICAAAGLLIGSVNLTGLGLKFSSLVLNLTAGSLFLSLVLIMLASIFLGMGMPTVSAYVILAVLGVPALVQLGVNPIAAHMFVLYFAIMSNVTPPVAVGAYTAAAIAQADPNRTAFSGLKISLGTFIIPYMFVFGPALLLQGSAGELVGAIVTALIGIFALTSSVQGWARGRMTWIERVLGFVGALLLIDVGLMTDVTGILILLVTFIWHWRRVQKEETLAQSV